jgi:hypothetical protein
MQIERYHRKQLPIGSAGTLIARRTDSYDELGRMGKMLTDFGFAFEEQRQQAEYHNQINNAKLEADKRFLEFQQSLDPNDTGTWEQQLETMQEAYGDILSKMTQGRAREDFSADLDQEKLRQQQSIWQYKSATDARNFRTDYQVNYRQFMEMAAAQPTKPEFDDSVLRAVKSLHGLELKDPDKPISAENLQPIEGHDDPLFRNDKIRLSLGKAWFSDAELAWEAQQLENLAKTYEQMAMTNPEEVLKAIDEGTLPEEIKNEPGIVQDLRSVAEGTQNYNKRRKKILIDSDIEDVHAKAAKLVPPAEMADIIRGKESLTDTQKTSLMDAYNKALAIWQETGINPYKTTTNWKKYYENLIRAEDGKLTKAEARAGVGPDGYGEVEYRKIISAMPDGDPGKSVGETKAGKTFSNLLRTIPALDADQLPLLSDELRPFAEEKGFRLLGSILQGDPDMTDQEKTEAAMRVYLSIKDDIYNGRITAEPSLLPGAGGTLSEQIEKDLNKIDLKALSKKARSPEQPSREEFHRVITRLKFAGKETEARAYYDKWVKELWP